jgi:hypothetical protein
VRVAASCTAVGEHAPLGGSAAALAEQWSGRSWSNQATPAISGSTLTDLLSVSCTSGSACVAVGYYDLPAAQSSFTLAERWNGSGWSIVAPLNVAITTFTNGTASIADTLPSSGTLTAAAAAGAPGHPAADIASTLIFDRVTIKVRKAGTVKFKIVAKGRAKALLQEHHKLPVTVTLTFRPKHGKTTTTHLKLTLKHEHKHK